MKYTIAVFLILFNTSTKANNYYFSTSTGDDSRTVLQAQNPATPWKTLNKLNSFFSSLQPGDSVLFKRGETFYGSINANKSGTPILPIIFSAYGIGDKPLISGLTTLTGWKNNGNGIWESDPCAAAGIKINILLLNDVSIPMGRYPNADEANKGFLTYTSHVGNTSITDYSLPASPNWTGAELIVRKERWTFDRSPIISHIGSTINYAPQTDYNAVDNYGYFIQNDIRTLDQFGEWYFNPSTKTVSILYDSVAPAVPIKVSTVNNLVIAKQYSNLTFDNISFGGSNGNLFELGNQQNISITNCDIKFAGIDAIYGVSINKFNLENSTILNTNNNAVNLAYNCKFITIKNNTIKGAGLYMGMGDAIHYGTLNGIGIGGSGLNSSRNALIEGNIVDSIGYNGISFNGDSVIVKNNVVSNFCITKDDGGGIYTSRGATDTYVYTGRRIIGNIVLDGKTAIEGTSNIGRSFTWGIYIDDDAQGLDILSNTVANMPNSGIFLHNAHEINIKNNTFFNNAEQIKFSYDGIAPIRNVIMNKNICVSKLVSQLVFLFSSFADDIVNFGSADSNYYARPIDDDLVFHIRPSLSDNYYNLAGWQVYSGKDAYSFLSPKKISDVNDLRFEYNPTSFNKSVSL
ncbi:MAG: right-handed parallel beta-helix repeat-containing protein, partial [Thermoproteota archaeon]|nr:right-handed parallel beta-helix repeat-containing protein [Thermoproteota archaeon]